MIISKYFIEFIVYAFLGWIYECSYCSIRTRHWSNRGFLYGPVCPIYGVGAILCSLVFGNFSLSVSGETPMWEIFVICAVGSAILEYTTSYVLETFFHAKWWDYSKVPFNVHGRICLPFTIAFGIAGCLIVQFVLPVSESVKAQMHPLLAEIAALIFMSMIAADTALTIQSLTDLTRKLDSFEEELNTRLEARYQAIQEIPAEFQAELQERQRIFSEKLTERQKYALNSIQNYTTAKTAKSAQRVRNYLSDLSKRIP